MRKQSKTAPIIAANRFGLGARPGDIVAIKANPADWLLNQIQGPSRTPAPISALSDSANILVEVREAREMRRQSRQQGKPASKDYAKTVRQHFAKQVKARYAVSAETDFPFHERLVHFWTNHFAISADKQPIPAIAGCFENEAIRPNVSGKFVDLLLAAEKHPGMLLYLDNQRSVGPRSKMGLRAAKRNSQRTVGLNENLAREILELHTLGVDGGYSQTDVTRFAEALTGWSIGSGRGRERGGEPGRFYFRNEIHQPGTVKLLGKNYSQDGIRQGESILRDLAMHPATARHISSKLARHFVADRPPATLVERMSREYLDSEGDLSRLYSTLVRSEEPWQNVYSKYKTPHDFLVSVFRALDYVPDQARPLFAGLEMMGQAPYRPGSPAGWPDTADHWGGADSLYKRIEWAGEVAKRVGNRADPLELSERILGATLGKHSRRAIARAESVQQGLVLMLVSPEFQRR